MTALYVIIGAAIGAPSRFLLDQYLRRYIKYPLGITVINVLGSFVIGLNINSTDNIQALVSIGFAGAFTTWSTFILDLYLAFELKQYKNAAINLVLSLTLGLCAVWLGMDLA
ncbi:MAG: CrcB family protein [Actinomycetota bacterium]